MGEKRIQKVHYNSITKITKITSKKSTINKNEQAFAKLYSLKVFKLTENPFSE